MARTKPRKSNVGLGMNTTRPDLAAQESTSTSAHTGAWKGYVKSNLLPKLSNELMELSSTASAIPLPKAPARPDVKSSAGMSNLRTSPRTAKSDGTAKTKFTALTTTKSSLTSQIASNMPEKRPRFAVKRPRTEATTTKSISRPRLSDGGAGKRLKQPTKSQLPSPPPSAERAEQGPEVEDVDEGMEEDVIDQDPELADDLQGVGSGDEGEVVEDPELDGEGEDDPADEDAGDGEEVDEQEEDPITLSGPGPYVSSSTRLARLTE